MYIGVDLGGTKIRAGLLDSGFKVLKVAEKLTQARQGKQAVLNNLFAVIGELNIKGVKGIGVGVKGMVDHRLGVVRESDKLLGRVKNLALAKLVSNKYKKKTFIDNDAKCFILAEGILGAGKGYEVVVGITLGTGVGGGILIKGTLYRGANGGAAEFGKMIIDKRWFDESKGKWGTFEQLTSGTAMDMLYKLKTGKKVGAKEVENKLYAGNKIAEEVFAEMSLYLAAGLANIIVSVNPSVIIMGGGVGKVRALVEPAIKQIPRYLAYRRIIKAPIRYAKLGPDAGLIGAALLAAKKI